MNEGIRVKNIRKMCAMSQETLAAEVGVTQSMISQIERGTKVLTVPMAKQIAEVLQVSVMDLIGVA